MNKYKMLSKPSKAAIWFTICNLLIKGISFISTPIFTRLMSEEEYGRLSIFMSYEQVILIFATWEMYMGAYQKGIFKFKQEVKLFSASTIILSNIITSIVFAALFLTRSLVFKYTGLSTTLLVILFFYLILYPAYFCWTVRKRTAYEYKSAVVVTLVASALVVIIPIIALAFIDKTANIKFAYSLSTWGIICAYFYINTIKDFHIKSCWSSIKQHWSFLVKFQGPLVWHSLSFLVLSQADRVMIGSMVGNVEAAFYSVAYSIANVAGLLQNALNQSLLPWRYEMLERKEYKKIKDNTTTLLVFVGGYIFLFILMAPEAMKLLFSKNYYESVWCIPPIATSMYFMFLYTVFVNVMSYFEKTKMITMVSVFCAFVNITLNYIGIKTFGYIVCAYTTLICYILFAIGYFIFLSRICKSENIKIGWIVDTKAIVTISIILLLAQIMATLTYTSWIIRYSCALIVIIIASIKKTAIKQALKKH